MISDMKTIGADFKQRGTGRQALRRATGLVSLALLPVTLYYLSPVVPLGGIAAGVVSGSLVVFATLFLSSLFLGRVFCGWICPVGAFQDILRTPQNPPRLRKRVLAVIRFVIFGAWVLGIAMISFRAGIPRHLDFFYLTDHGISVVERRGMIILSAVLALFGLLTILLGRRGGCRSVCWIAPFMQAGSALGRRLHIPQLSIVLDGTRGSADRSCSDVCPMALNPYRVAAAAKHKGPAYDRTECVLCARCVDRCGAGLRIGWTRPGRKPAHRRVTALIAVAAAGVLLPRAAAALELAPEDIQTAEDHELTVGWGWDRDSALTIRYVHSPFAPFLVRWSGTIPLAEDREQFAPEAGFGLGVTTGMRADVLNAVSLVIDSTWAYRRYADIPAGIAGLTIGASWVRHIGPGSVGATAQLRLPLWTDDPNVTLSPADTAIQGGLSVGVGPWAVFLGASWRDADFAAAYGRDQVSRTSAIASLAYSIRP